MSTTMDQIHHIREMFYQQDKNISQIASETGLNRKTVSKYVDMEDFSSPSIFVFVFSSIVFSLLGIILAFFHRARNVRCFVFNRLREVVPFLRRDFSVARNALPFRHDSEDADQDGQDGPDDAEPEHDPLHDFVLLDDGREKRQSVSAPGNDVFAYFVHNHTPREKWVPMSSAHCA